MTELADDQITEEVPGPNEYQPPVGLCPVHPEVPDPEDCQGCKDEMTAWQAHLEQAMASNGDRITQLQQQGVKLDPVSLLVMRLDLFIGMAVQSERGRAMFEDQYHRQIAGILGTCEAQIAVRKAEESKPKIKPANMSDLSHLNRQQRRKGKGPG